MVHTKQLTSTGSVQSAAVSSILKMAECLSDADSFVEVIEPEAEFFLAVNSFSEQQTTALEDSIEASIMLQYNYRQ